MATVNLGGYDPNTGWPPDDSTGVNWDSDVDIPGQFGRGGFYGAPRLTAPASGPPPGVSLSGPGGTPTNAAGMSPHIDPTTGQPEMLTGPGGVVEKTRGALNPFGFLGGSNPYWRGAIAAGGVLTPTPTANDAAPTNLWFQRPSGVGGMPGPQVTNPPVGGPGGIGSDANRPVLGAGGFPTTYANPGAQPPAPDGMPPPAIPIGGGPGNVMQSPSGTMRPRGRAAGPAAARQQPNLGAYGGSPFTTVDRPNANPGIGGGMLGGGMNGPRGQGGAPVATALDLSRLFGGGQPAPVAAAPVRAPVAAPVYHQPSIRVVPPTIPIGGGAGNIMEAPTGTPRRKSSSTSQGGGY